MTEIPRETRVLDAVVSLVDSLLDDFDVVDLLTELTEDCAELLDVTSAGLLLANPLRDHLHLMAATSEKIHDLELFQLQADQGPCLDCYGTGQPISVPDLQTEARALAAVRCGRHRGGLHLGARGADARGRHCIGCPGLVRHRGRGAQRRRSAGGPDVGAHRVRGDPAGHPATLATVLPHLHTALTSRIVVDQAKGFLSQRLDVSVDDAFTLLRRYARTHGDHLTKVSRRLITEPEARPAILAAMSRIAAAPPS